MHPTLIALRAPGVSVPVVTNVTRALAAAIGRSGPPVLLTDEHGPADGDAVGRVPSSVALGVRTSGSTGEPRTVLLGREALVASARATHERLGGPGAWVLCLPLNHIAGVQVLVRSLEAGTTPTSVEGRFCADAWLRAVVGARDAHPGLPVHTALVPTQLHRVVRAAHADGDLRAALTRHAPEATLLGGAAAAPSLLADAGELGLTVIRTYGMTETVGGCVYDGVPLAGVEVDVVDGVVEIAGPVLAEGYLDRPDLDAAAFAVRDGVRRLVTQDLGEWVEPDPRGEDSAPPAAPVPPGPHRRLRVLGRRDDMVVTGGEKVAPAAVEALLAPILGPVCVVGVPDHEWGEAVVAVATAPGPGLAALREEVARTLGRAAAPRHLVVVPELPERGPGKIDRALVARWAREETHGHGT